ncbi:SMP-30/gluconolactonase/LRE family protein [Pseudoclavibacter terrae]|uniref:SMP-30/gluconolactonase/LRE family protein n=1 Tax=Pseudoclavibacter terrae TaxID=1530195 RepID=A0A7J5B3G6_9MICO|nr:SMP-30/gluconolactonase/LRE family protein [Pseudoclavibacter terrae]KAB1638566.1 SMP-30/gluconolactonase/LRE family protein [Pseudoclavibacter terrae]
MTSEPNVFRELRSVLVESIWWDARTDELAWVDITAGTFHRGRLDGARDGSDDRVVELPAPVSAIQPAQGDGFVASLRDRIVELDADGHLTKTLASVEHSHGGIRFNEGKVDPFGRFVVGSMNTTSTDPDGALYTFDADGTVRMLLGGFHTTNGLEWSDSGDTVYVTDTSTQTIYRAAYGPGPEDLGELEPFIRGRNSDGLARAVDGSFWNGIYGAGSVAHWSSDGDPLGDLSVPAPNVTSVAFGGEDLSTLFVGTARENLTEEGLTDAPLSGSIFAFEDTGRGRATHAFGATGQSR